MKFKKLILSLSIAFIVALGALVCVLGINREVTPAVNNSKVQQESVNKTPKYRKFAPNTIKIVEGGSEINYTYSPDVNAGFSVSLSQNEKGEYYQDITSTAEGDPVTIAYEYCFGNTMDRTSAINLESISTEEVNVSYIYSEEKINPALSHTAVTKFTCQTLAEAGNAGSKKYFYILVSPTESEISATFTSNIVWWYGIPQQINLSNNVAGTPATTTIVTNQEMTLNALPDTLPNVTSEKYGECYFDAWFYDEKCTKIIGEEDVFSSNTPVYARYHNISPDMAAQTFSCGSTGCGFNLWVFFSSFMDWGENVIDTDILDYIFPTYYNGLPVTYVYGQDTSSIYGFKTVNLPETIEVVGDYLAVSIYGLEEINIPSSVTSIGEHAYSGVDFRSVTIPEGVTYIGESAFDGTALEVYNLSSLDITAGSMDHGRVAREAKVVHTSLFEKSWLTTINGIKYCKNDAAATTLTVYGVEDKTLTSLTLDSRTTEIFSEAFYNCSSLTSITISSSVTSIGYCAFYNCSSLTSIIIPISVTSIGYSAFYNCSNLTSITIPSGVTSIGNSAFYNCSRLTSVIFEDPNNWRAGNTAITIPNAATAATYLTSTYISLTWTKVA